MTVAPPGPTLIVPIDVAAFCVGTDDRSGTTDSPYCTRDFARVAADFSTLPYLDANGQSVNSKAYIGEQVMPQPFDTDADGLAPGVHLHWALPDALAHGVSDDDGNVQFRLAPNRWLVVRIASSRATPAAPAVALKAWVVESDHLWDQEAVQGTLGQNANSRTVPLQPQTRQHANKSYQSLGRVFPHESWAEQPGGTYLSKHTALGYGAVTYAAAYPHCPNVFGMHDPLDDLDLATFAPPTSRLSYLVVGWYSTTDNDPLAQFTYTQDATQPAQLQQAFHWTFAADANTPIPTQIVCDGLLTDVPWNPSRRYVVKRSETPLQVAIGNTTVEALSALLASQPGLQGLDQVERVLNWLQLNMLARLGQPGALGEIEEAQYQADFSSTTAGTIWQVQRATPGNTTPDGVPVTVNDQDLLDAAGGVEVTLPEDLAGDLDDLNVAQLAYDKATFDLESRRRQVFADWYKYMLLEYPEQGASPTPLTADQAYHYVEGEVTALNTASTACDGLKTTRDTLHDNLVTKLGKGYLLTSVASPRYWQANDPVLLLSGEDAEPSYRHGGDGRFDPDGNLVCRLTSGLLTAMTVAATGGHGPWTVHTGDLPALPAPQNQPHLAEIQALVGEAFFLDQNQAWRLAQAVKAQGGDGNPAAQLDALVPSIQAAQANLLGAAPVTTPVSFAGQAPSPVGVQTWAQPWIPLMLQWEIYYYPLQPIGTDTGQRPDYPADFITSNCQLDDDDIDLTYLQPIAPNAANLQIYQGSLVLSHNTEINLASQIDRFVANYPTDSHVAELQTIKANLRLSMMAQALDGFNQALLMRHQTLQLPVADPLAISSGPMHWRFTNQTVANAVDQENTLSPLPLNSYNPLRAGALEVTRLRIVDAFGQVRDVDKPQLLRAESLRPAGEGPSGTLATLPPRITQPGRVLLRWLSAADDKVETNSHPASSPICGWVLFNHLDDSLMLYAADGTPLGSLNVRGPVWQGAPGNNATFDQPIETALVNANPHLQKFAFGIAHNPNAVNFLRDLLTTIDATVTLVNPASFKQDHGLSVLISQPLALCRASLRLELQGLPSLDQHWSVFDAAVTASQANNDTYTIDDARDAGNFPRVTFPVRLGDLSQIDDGLIGYVVDDGTEQAYRTFYAAASTSQNNGVVRPRPDQLLLTADDGAADVLLTLLMDPRASVHATTGMLPVKSLRIPPDLYAPALNRLSVSFLTAPVLSPAASFAVPTPNESGYVWSWVTRTPGAAGWTIVDPVNQLNPGATLASPQQIGEGWLNLHKAPPPPTNGTA